MYLGRRSERVPFSIKTCECLFLEDRCHEGGVGAKNKSLFDIFLNSDLKGISPERPERFSFNEAFLHAWWVTLVEAGAPNENIIQNHLNIALLNVF